MVPHSKYLAGVAPPLTDLLARIWPISQTRPNRCSYGFSWVG
jgi:hypothetical protein